MWLQSTLDTWTITNYPVSIMLKQELPSNFKSSIIIVLSGFIPHFYNYKLKLWQQKSKIWCIFIIIINNGNIDAHVCRTVLQDLQQCSQKAWKQSKNLQRPFGRLKFEIWWLLVRNFVITFSCSVRDIKKDFLGVAKNCNGSTSQIYTAPYIQCSLPPRSFCETLKDGHGFQVWSSILEFSSICF